MAKRIILLVIVCIQTCMGFSQTDTARQSTAAIFERLTREAKEYRLDTSAVPEDRITRKIRELRSLRGGFNINEALEFKFEEDRQKNEVPRAETERMAAFFTSGDGKRWLDNAVIWIYRNRFTYEELKRMVRFYRSAAGQKMAADFPVIMLQTLRAAELIRGLVPGTQGNGPGNK